MNERDLFISAVQIEDAAERAAYLDRACGGDAGLRQRAEALLSAFGQAGSFLQQPAEGPISTLELPPDRAAANGAASEAPGSLVGPYKLLQLIGEGGMGTVWLAEQAAPVQRKVALKVIKAGMDSKQVLARFEAERQALALMDHPNIAKVFDAGAVGESSRHTPCAVAGDGTRSVPTTFGRPYFAMELVKGTPITKYCDEHRLPPNDRLELFVSVCQAVQHAHQKGIIHRDLKPSNVLVAPYDGKPVVKVIDFGVAKAAGQRLTDKTLFTEFGAVVGTPEYMSPEQAELNNQDIDTRSDIYSLGILLYELLTGTTPLTRKRAKEAALLEVLRLIREEEPQRPSTRLSSTDELPSIAASRGLEPKRLSGLVRGELDWIVMKALEKDRTRRYETANGFAMDIQRYLADEAVQACPPSAGYRLRKFARRNKRALAVAGLILFFILLLGGGSGWVLRDRSARLATTKREGETALAEATQLAGQKKWPEALAWVQRAEGVLAQGTGSDALRRRVQDLRRDLEMIAKLEEIRLQATEVIDNHFDFESRRPAYAQVFRDCGIDVNALDAEEAAERIRARTIPVELVAVLDDWAWTMARDNERLHLSAVARLADPDPWRNRLRDALQQGDRKALEALATSDETNRLSPQNVEFLAIALMTAEAIEQRLTLLRQAQQRYPDDFWINTSLGICLTDEIKPGRPQEAVRFFTAAVALRPRSPGTHYNLGCAFLKSGSHDDAIAAFREALRLKPDYSQAHNNLGNALMAQNKLNEAIVCYTKAIELNPKYEEAHTNLGDVLMAQRKMADAIACYKKAIVADPNSAVAHNKLGIALKTQGKLGEAIACYKTAIKLDPKQAGYQHNLGNALSKQGKLNEAAVAYRKAIELDPKSAPSHYSLGNTLKTRWKLDEAIACYRTAIELNPNYAEAHTNLGVSLIEQGKLDEAIDCCQTAIKLDRKLVQAHLNLGRALQKHGNLDKAIAAYRKAVELDPKFGFTHYNLANALVAQGKRDDAIAAYREAIRLQPDFEHTYYRLGVVLKDLRKFEEAALAFRKVIELEPNRFLLAMAHWQLDNKADARKWYDKGVEWMDKNQPENNELHRFRVEAAELLRVAVEVGPPPREKK